MACVLTSRFQQGDGADRAAGATDKTYRQTDVEEALTDHAFQVGEILGVDDATVSQGAMGGESRLGIDGHGGGVVDAGALATHVDDPTIG